MAVTQRQKGKAASPPQNTSTGLKLCIGPQQKKSVLKTLDELDVIGKGSAEDESDSDNDNDGSQLYLTVPHKFPWSPYSPHGVLMEFPWTP
jgi:hypothetical protein